MNRACVSGQVLGQKPELDSSGGQGTWAYSLLKPGPAFQSRGQMAPPQSPQRPQPHTEALMACPHFSLSPSSAEGGLEPTRVCLAPHSLEGTSCRVATSISESPEPV